MFFQTEKLNPLSEMRVVLIGGRKTGKSSCGNTILSGECFNTDTPTSTCTEKQAQVNNKMVTVLDTPGCFSVTSDLLMPSCAVLLVVNASCSFQRSQWEAIEKQLEEGGGQLWSRAMVLFSYGDWLGDAGIEPRIESEGELLQRLIEKCGNRYHALDNKRWWDRAQAAHLIEQIEEILVENRVAVLHRGSVFTAEEQQPEAPKRDVKELMSRRRQLSCDCKEVFSQHILSCSQTQAVYSGLKFVVTVFL